MELFYNPSQMSETEIKATFVARKALLDELVSIISKQAAASISQHIVIIAPRGMGKTTMLLMLRFTIREKRLNKKWQVVQFPEERFGIYDLADFWMEIIDHLAEETNDASLSQRKEELKREYPKNEDLQEATLALLKDWKNQSGKRILLLVDSFDKILEQINDERDNARLRDVLMNDNLLMLVGGATTFFHEARAYNQPLYNFFKIYDLSNLSFEQIQDLLRRRATQDNLKNFEQTLRANRTRLKVLEYFTGGNPRLVLMLYRIVINSEITEVKKSLEKLLDEVTPYYQAKVESLPPQQRKIMDYIALRSSETNEGLTPGEIAKGIRLSSNQTSAQLKRLVELGYLTSSPTRRRYVFYSLSERLYALWYQMRFGRSAREKMKWLIEVLKAIYSAEELKAQSGLLTTRFYNFMDAGFREKALDVLEHHFYLAKAMTDSSSSAETIDQIICRHIEAKDIETLKKEVLPAINLLNVSKRTQNALIKAGCLTRNSLKAQTQQKKVTIISAEEQAVAFSGLMKGVGKSRKEQIVRVDGALQKAPSNPLMLLARAILSGATDDKAGMQKYLGRIQTANLKDINNQVSFSLTMLLMFGFLVEFEDLEEAKKLWEIGFFIINKVDEIRKKTLEKVAFFDIVISPDDELIPLFETAAYTALLNSATTKKAIVKQFIESMNLKDKYTPILYAIEYLETRNEEIIERLSPEVKGIVKTVLDKLDEKH